MKSSVSELESLERRVKSAEVSLSEMQDMIYTISSEIKETQKFLIKLAHNQAELSKRVSQWPYIVVNTEK